MKIVVFGEHSRVGALVGDRVLDLAASNPALPAGLRQFIEGGQRALEEAQRAIDAIDRAPEGAVLGLKDVRLRAPWPERRIACVGGNFADHLRGMDRGSSRSLEQVTDEARAAGQWGFWKVPAFVSGPHDDVAYPKRTEYFDYEGEAALVIGKRGRDIAADRLDEYVWGVTLFNDLSIRDGMGGPQRPMSYNLAKNFDGSTSMGPCIAVGEVSPSAVDVETRINGEVRQQFNTRDMVFSFSDVLEYLSRDFTFVPGDVIAGGTAAGTAADKTVRAADGTRPKDLFLKVGDRVAVSSPQVGTLDNRIVA
ncbi:MAG: fumarylacetoacetate hydrolase family protein [Chloroflexi bacterium]|nr:fumarylacetoacetate hydrolase family protein [Chloroflexota bacterium]MBV9595237.1 fumarylacetoacetate hydrolase family protein [Chloroflexota bacterium]